MKYLISDCSAFCWAYKPYAAVDMRPRLRMWVPSQDVWSPSEGKVRFVSVPLLFFPDDVPGASRDLRE